MQPQSGTCTQHRDDYNCKIIHRTCSHKLTQNLILDTTDEYGMRFWTHANYLNPYCDHTHTHPKSEIPTLTTHREWKCLKRRVAMCHCRTTPVRTRCTRPPLNRRPRPSRSSSQWSGSLARPSVRAIKTMPCWSVKSHSQALLAAGKRHRCWLFGLCNFGYGFVIRVGVLRLRVIFQSPLCQSGFKSNTSVPKEHFMRKICHILETISLSHSIK